MVSLLGAMLESQSARVTGVAPSDVIVGAAILPLKNADGFSAVRVKCPANDAANKSGPRPRFTELWRTRSIRVARGLS